MMNNLMKSITGMKPKAPKYIKRTIREHRIFQLVTVYMAFVTFVSQLMRIFTLESEKEYNYALKYIQENFGQHSTYGIIAYIFIDAFFASYNMYMVIASAAQTNGACIRFIDMTENIEGVNRTSMDQKTVNYFLKYAAKRHVEIFGYVDIQYTRCFISWDFPFQKPLPLK
nr:unnamed protein product [Callosobruchus chinensis]